MANGVRAAPLAVNGSALREKQVGHLDDIRSPQEWYDPSTFDRLRRLALEVASGQPSSVPKVYEALVGALADGMRRERKEGREVVHERDPRGDCITIAGTVWETRAHLKAHCQDILRRYEENARVEEPDFVFMSALLAFHPRGQEKLEGCQGMVVGVHPVHRARCFYVQRQSGSEDFSYIRCVDNAPTEEVMAQLQICKVLCSVLQLHPASCESVAHLIEENFPTYRGKVGAMVERHRNWTKSILELCSRMPALTEFLLRVLFRRLLEIDAAIQKLEGELEPEDAHGVGYAPDDEATQKQSQLNVMADILDAKMMMLFEWLQRNLDGGGESENQLVCSLMEMFESTVMLTHRARCVQFLWFYIVSLRPSWTEALLSLLLRTAFSPNTAIPKRLLSLAYLASFVARAKFLTTTFTLRTAQYVATLAREQMPHAEARVANGEMSHPHVLLFLYSVQALCYIICFHADSFAQPMEPPSPPGTTPFQVLLYSGGREVGAEAFGPVLESPVNPIARINRQVAEQFCHCLRPHLPQVALALEQRISEFTHQQAHFCQGEELAGLDIFFPFDPYRLRHSSMFVLSIYRDWVDDEASNADVAEEAEGFVKAKINAAPRAQQSDSASISEGSDVDFMDVQDAAERGFIPSVGPSPAFRPRGSTDMADIMSPLCISMGSALDDDDGFTLPSASLPVDTAASSMLLSFINSPAFREGGEGAAAR